MIDYKIMIVDDEPDILNLLEKALNTEGCCHLFKVENGPAAANREHHYPVPVYVPANCPCESGCGFPCTVFSDRLDAPAVGKGEKRIVFGKRRKLQKRAIN